MTNPTPHGRQSPPAQKPPRKVACVHLEGAIQPGGAINYFTAGALLEMGFVHPDTEAVVLYINSPGGTPAQSEMIANKVRDLSKKYKKPVYAVVGDVAASGGYWIAASAEEIYAQKTSTLGSIGVRSDIKSHAERLKQEGIEQRTITSGEHKAGVDPNKPLDEQEAAIQQQLEQLEAVHKEFIKWIIERRGRHLDKSLINKQEPLKSPLFSGKTYVGEDAVKAGLADGIGTLDAVREAKFGQDSAYVHVTPQTYQHLLQELHARKVVHAQGLPANQNVQPPQTQGKRPATPKRRGPQ